jgi:tripartite-type tricarboxylate transporter receptor subunit TctC
MNIAFAFAAALAAATLSPLAHAQPATAAGASNGPIRLLSGAPPGTPADVAARVISEPLASELGQPVIVENRPGAINTIAMAAVAKSPPDGLVLGLFGMVSTVAPAMLAAMPYDTLHDLVPVGQLSSLANVLVVRADSPIRSFDQLLEAARAAPGKLTYASGGNGTPAHLAGELLEQRLGVDLLHVPFKGAVAGVVAVIGGHVDLMFATTPAVAEHVRSGRLRALATTASERIAALPDVPSGNELGRGDLVVRDWNGIVAPAGTPAATVERLAAALKKVLAQESVQARLRAVGMEAATGSDPAAFRALIESELARWTAVVREAGLRAD